MKKRIISALLSVLVLLCAGCSQEGKGSNDERGAMSQGTSQSRQTAVAISDSVKQNATKTVTGTVQSIVGNEVTLLITAQSKGAEGSDTDNAERQNRGERGERPNREMAAGENAAEMPQAVRFAEGEREQRRAVRENTQQNSDGSATEETKNGSKSEQQTVTYLLPVGMSMGSKDYSSVTAGNTLKIYFGSHPDDGSEIITGVEVTSSRR